MHTPPQKKRGLPCATPLKEDLCVFPTVHLPDCGLLKQPKKQNEPTQRDPNSLVCVLHIEHREAQQPDQDASCTFASTPYLITQTYAHGITTGALKQDKSTPFLTHLFLNLEKKELTNITNHLLQDEIRHLIVSSLQVDVNQCALTTKAFSTSSP